MAQGASAVLAFQTAAAGCPGGALDTPYLFRWNWAGVNHLATESGTESYLATDSTPHAAVWIRANGDEDFSYFSHEGGYALERETTGLGLGPILDVVSTSTYFGVLSRDETNVSALVWSNLGCQ